MNNYVICRLCGSCRVKRKDRLSHLRACGKDPKGRWPRETIIAMFREIRPVDLGDFSEAFDLFLDEWAWHWKGVVGTDPVVLRNKALKVMRQRFR